MLASDFWFQRSPLTAVGSVAVTPSDTADNILDANSVAHVALALYATVAGAVCFVGANGETDTVTVAANTPLPVPVKRVKATGTTATGIHAFI